MIKQFSVDIEGDVTKEDVQRILDNMGMNVVGISWTATWEEDDAYWKGDEPTSWN